MEPSTLPKLNYHYIAFRLIKKKTSAKKVASSWETNPITCPVLLSSVPL